MKALVTVKRVIDPYVKVRVRADGLDVEKNDVKMAMNPFCENALEEALRWKDNGVVTEVVAMSAGGADTAETLRMALAMGADRAILVNTEMLPVPLIAAKLIAAVARREKPEVIWMGKQAADGDFNQTGQMVAALLGWGQGLFLSAATLEDGTVSADSEVDNGIVNVRIKLPCVLTADLRLNQPRYATLPNIMKARRKPMEELTAADLGVDLSPRLKVLRVSEPPPRPSGRKVADAQELVRVLREEAKVLS
ncbi:electron transfer flavoprotein subunit beta/FixA family protein [Candidatus Persebacteraceae bacterium Df01]|jgi:electron transfer flavoprotein beta subunit|uniref:Electron transfer flavoprotein subunit beta n=1 Tax=Candidatus Doriopsillibacter californiensis TaxID=2970740 RepID=A0ABT7QLW9_9GAMM|nr:electron transfer flavoprotein subunit beta/FixA family protein [Candidatus Persebacteraceae bacterium Df01]